MTRAIVTSTYRYKPPPRRKRKGPRIEVPAIVTIDPKTRIARRRSGEGADAADPKKSRRRRVQEPAAAEVTTARTPAGDAQPSKKPPPPVNDDRARTPGSWRSAEPT